MTATTRPLSVFAIAFLAAVSACGAGAEVFAAGDDAALPPGLDREPEPVARIVYRGHRPFIELNEELREPLVNVCPVGDPDNERAALGWRTRRPGTTAIWIGPAGGVTDDGFDDAAMSALTGVAASGVARRPRIVCRDPGATRFVAANGILYHAKTLAGGARSIVVPEMPAGSDGSGPGVYAQILKEAGAWQYTAPGSYFRRHGDVFLFHTGTPGTHAIALPDDVAKVRELFTGAEFDSNPITLETDGPQTWLFRATPRGDWSVGEPAERAARRNGP